MNPVFLIALFSSTSLLFEDVAIVSFPLLKQIAALLRESAPQPAPPFIYCYLQENSLGRTESHGTPREMKDSWSYWCDVGGEQLGFWYQTPGSVTC